MAIVSGQTPGLNLDSPPPLPDSTKRPAPPQSNLMMAGGLGHQGSSPQATVIQAMAGIEQNAKLLSAFLPETAAILGPVLGQLRPLIAQMAGQMTGLPQQGPAEPGGAPPGAPPGPPPMPGAGPQQAM